MPSQQHCVSRVSTLVPFGWLISSQKGNHQHYLLLVVHLHHLHLHLQLYYTTNSLFSIHLDLLVLFVYSAHLCIHHALHHPPLQSRPRAALVLLGHPPCSKLTPMRFLTSPPPDKGLDLLDGLVSSLPPIAHPLLQPAPNELPARSESASSALSSTRPLQHEPSLESALFPPFYHCRPQCSHVGFVFVLVFSPGWEIARSFSLLLARPLLSPHLSTIIIRHGPRFTSNRWCLTIKP